MHFKYPSFTCNFEKVLEFVNIHEGDKEGYKEALNISFTIEDPRYKKTYGFDYEYAEAFFQFLLSGEPYLPQEFLKKYPHTKRFLDSGELPETFSSAYGPKIKRQLPRVIELLKENPKTRRAVIHILSEEDKTILDHETTMEYPCTNSLQLFIREGKLDFLCSMRSNNVLAVMPYDVYIFASLQEHIAGLLGISLGNYHHQIASAHFFKRDQEKANLLLENLRWL